MGAMRSPMVRGGMGGMMGMGFPNQNRRGPQGQRPGANRTTPGGVGGMRPRQQPAAPQQRAAVPSQANTPQNYAVNQAVATPTAMGGGGNIDPQALAQTDDATAKQMIGERIFPLIQEREPKLAGKITGMLLEMDNTELLNLLDDSSALQNKIQEAMAVLRAHTQQQSHMTSIPSES